MWPCWFYFLVLFQPIHHFTHFDHQNYDRTSTLLFFKPSILSQPSRSLFILVLTCWVGMMGWSGNYTTIQTVNYDLHFPYSTSVTLCACVQCLLLFCKISTGLPILLHFTDRVFFFFNKLRVCGKVALSKSIGTIFRTAFVFLAIRCFLVKAYMLFFSDIMLLHT